MCVGRKFSFTQKGQLMQAQTHGTNVQASSPREEARCSSFFPRRWWLLLKGSRDTGLSI